jgi:hypothetical protein
MKAGERAQAMTDRMQIVIAWTEESVEVVQARRTDLGERPVTRTVKVAKACTWLLDGGADDLARAESFARREGHRVYTTPVGFEDSLVDARAKVIGEVAL